MLFQHYYVNIFNDNVQINKFLECYFSIRNLNHCIYHFKYPYFDEYTKKVLFEFEDTLVDVAKIWFCKGHKNNLSKSDTKGLVLYIFQITRGKVAEITVSRKGAGNWGINHAFWADFLASSF